MMRLTFALLALAIAGVVGWTAWHFRGLNRFPEAAREMSGVTSLPPFRQWQDAVARVRAERSGGVVETPAELKHYDDRYWFLATQVAEVAKYNIPTCQDYFDLAAQLQRGELVSVPGVTDTFVLYGVAQRVDDGEFTPFEGNVPAYGPLQALASNFGGRSYDLNLPADRVALKSNMLSSLRPVALKVMEEIAAAYHEEFSLPLPVSSLVRPEQYQRSLRRVNRNAVLIETPPHSTGLAFDIDYRYMSGAEQTFIMNDLARLKNAGQIEAIRERNANFHVFAFVNGSRPSDELIAAKLEEVTPPGKEQNESEASSKTKTRRPGITRPKRRRR